MALLKEISSGFKILPSFLSYLLRQVDHFLQQPRCLKAGVLLPSDCGKCDPAAVIFSYYIPGNPGQCAPFEASIIFDI